MDRALYQCENPGCKQQLTMFVSGLVECAKCGAKMRIVHPLTIAYSVNGKTEFSSWAIENYVEEGMKKIYERLSAERELDRLESIWYNEKKRGSDGEEDDNCD